MAVPSIDGEQARGQRNVLTSKSFRDGAIYLFIRGDYKKDTWMCRVKVPGMIGYKTRSTRTTDEHQAYKFADDLYNKLLVETLSGGPSSNGGRISKAIDAFIERIEPLRARQSIHYRILLLKRVKPLIGSERFGSLDTSMISRLTSDLGKGTKGGCLSPNTVKRYHSDLKHFFSWCVEEGYLQDVPRFPRTSGDQARRPHFNETEWRKLTRHLREFIKVENRKTLRDRTMLVNFVLIMANTGLRPGEARNLKWRDVRSSNGHVVLTVTGKTGIREVVARTPEVKRYFQRIFGLRLNELGVDGKPTKALEPDSLVFCHKDGRAIDSFKKSFRTLLANCGLKTDTFGRPHTIYSLRHTYATFRLHESVDVYALAMNMGTSVDMIERFYGHTSNVRLSDELTKSKQRPAKAGRPAKTKAGDPIFGWLASDEEPKKSQNDRSSDDDGPATFVDLISK